MSPFRRRIYAVSLIDEVGPFMTLYALWFADNGMTIEHVSLVFAVWAVTTLVAEVPTGLIADWLDRRVVLVGGVALRALGIAVFLLVPTLLGFLVGAALWAMQMASQSGSWEALVYQGLAVEGDEETYETVMARASQFNQVGIVLGTGMAGIALFYGVGLAALGWVTVVMSVLTGALIASLPAGVREEDDDISFLAGLVAGVRHMRATEGMLWLVGLGGLLESVFVLDEYMPALGVAVGTSDHWIPALVLSLWVGLVVGGEVAARRPGLSIPLLATAAVSGVVVGVIGLVLHHPLAVCLLAVPYAAMNLLWIAMDARLQHGLDDRARATVGSLRSFFGSLGSLTVFGGFAWLITDNDPTVGLVLCLLTVLGVAAAMAVVLPARPATR